MRRRKRTPRWRLALLLGAGVVAIGAAVWFTRPASRPTVADGAAPGAVRVLIPVGSSFRAAADSLGAVGLVRWPRVFSLYAAYKGRDRTIRAGTYQLERGLGWDALIDALHTGKGVVATVTIPEGWHLRRIVPHLARELGIPADSFDAAVRDSALRARLGVPTETLEGYLFPDTYTIALGSTARQVVALMVSRFERVWRPAWTARLDTLRRSRHEVVTLASIVEREVRHREEHPVVAAVYWNRLRINMPLQADPTVLYALGRTAARVLYRDLEVRSPYNTYRNRGLPPGPIGSPGAAAIESTLYPAQVPYRYFVATADGHHEFRTTFVEHQEAVRQVRARARADSARRQAVADSVAAAGTAGAARPDTTVSPATGPGGA